MAKQKRSQKFVTAIIIGIMTCTVIAMGSLLVMFLLPIEADYSAASQATAQYLEQYQPVSPTFMRVNQDCRDDTPHCLWILPDIINGESDPVAGLFRLADTLIIKIDGDITQDLTPVLYDSGLYIDLELSAFGAGLHLIEVQVSDKDGRIYQHSWAARSETGSVDAPPTLAVPPTYATVIPPEEQP